jgi:coenzyme F420-reducing hydrogenase delta subunit
VAMGDPSNSGARFQPAIAGIFCEKCGDDCLSATGETHGEFPAGLKSVRTICAEQVGPDLIRRTFARGADGVLICGCLVGHCHTLDNNHQVLAHIHRTRLVLKELGLAPGRLRQEWICSPGGDSVREIIEEFTEQIRELGPVGKSTLQTLSQNA